MWRNILMSQLRLARLLLVLMISIAEAQASDTPRLSADDWKAIDAFVEKYSAKDQIRNSVGQLLLIGVPGDAMNTGDSQTQKLLKERGVGGVFLNAYYYRGAPGTIQDRIQAAVNFHNALQSLALQSTLHLPVILAADAEGPDSGLAPAMYLPPIEALTLAATCDGELIRANAQVTGNQLRALGVHMVMGPVLDVSRRWQAAGSGYPLGTRTFGASVNWVATSASHYAAGLRDAQMLIVAKHFPGLGSLTLNTKLHAKRDFPDLIGGDGMLGEDIQLYAGFTNRADGIMTAHVKVTALAIEGEKQIVTKSKVLVDDLVRTSGSIKLSNDSNLPALNAPEMLVVTDDLSDMGPAVWERDQGATLADQAWEAFMAGHDLLLIAHVETEAGKPPRGEFASVSYDDVVRVLDLLTKRILEDEKNISRFRQSLRRIVAAKAKLALAQDQTVKTLLDGKAQFQVIAPDESRMTTIRIEGTEKRAIDGKQILQRTFDAATISLFPGMPGAPNLANMDPAQYRVALFVDEDGKKVFNTKFDPNWNKRWRIFELRGPGSQSQQDVEQQLNDLKQAAVDAFNVYDKVIFTVRKKDDFTLIDHVRLKVTANTLRDKGLVLLHTTPYDIPEELTQKVAFIGSFSQHQLSYQSDARLLSAEFKPSSIVHLPLPLPGDVGVRPVPFVAVAGMERLKIAVDTESGRLRGELQVAHDEIDRLKNAIAASKKDQSVRAPAIAQAATNSIQQSTVGTGLCALSLVTLTMAVVRLGRARKRGLVILTAKPTLSRYSRTRLRIDVIILFFAGALTIAAAWSQPLSWLTLIIFLACALVSAKEFFSRTKVKSSDGTFVAVSSAMSDWSVLAWVGAALLSGFLAASEFGITLGEAVGHAAKYVGSKF